MTRARVPGAARDFSPGVYFFSADSLMVSVQPPCAIACINICAHVKNPTHWQPYHCLNTGKYCTHWQPYHCLNTGKYCTHWQPYHCLNTGKYCTHWQPYHCLNTGRTGSAALAIAVRYPGRATQIFRKGQ